MRPGSLKFRVFSCGLESWFRRCAVIVRRFAQCGQLARISHLLALIDEARKPGRRPYDSDMYVEAQTADCREDILEAQYVANPCRETAKALIQAKKLSITREQECVAGLMEMWEL
jgi:hypothetical protein